MPAPALTITGTLQDVFGVADSDSSLVVQLCNFGSQVPRISGTALLAKTSPTDVDCPAGTFSFLLYGNDVIVPGNTYYTIQVKDDNGNIVQTNAYQFSGGGSIDLSTVAPYTPYTPPPTPAPQPGTLDVIVPYSTTPNFNALNTAGIIEFEITLTGDVTGPTLVGLTPGQIVTFVIVQDGVGAHTFAWPAAVKNAGIIDATANAICVQSFIVRSTGNLYPIGPMSVN